MAAVTRRKNIRVEIEPDTSWIPAHKTPQEVEEVLIQRARDITRQIVRHLDGDSLAGGGVRYDTIQECGFCAEPWSGALMDYSNATLGEPIGLPVCCDKAQEEFWREHKDLWVVTKTYAPWVGYTWPWDTEHIDKQEEENE